MTAVTRTTFSSAPFYPWLSDYRWSPDQLSYSFPSDAGAFGYQPPGTIAALSPSQQDAVRTILAEVEGFTGLHFVETAETTFNPATLRFAAEPAYEGGYAYYPDFSDEAGDAFFGYRTVNPHVGNEAYVYFLHEIGHALGMGHGHEVDPFNSSGLNSQEFTVMTYSDYVGDPDLPSYDGGPVDWAQSFMQLDIAALQHMYGANYAPSGEIWSGDTVYLFNASTGAMSVNFDWQPTPAGNRIFRTIWDGHGTDTYDLHDYATDLLLNLAPGAWSVFDRAQLADLNRFADEPGMTARGNLANARLVNGDLRALIENARGGSGDDRILGNRANNLLKGESGDDMLSGFGGADTLLGGFGRDDLDGAKGRDTLKGGLGRDRLEGGSGGDILSGGKARDVLIGNTGRDHLSGGAGIDRLTGGVGADVFVYRNAGDAPVGARIERIVDFEVRDLIDFSKLVRGRFDLALTGPLSGDGPSIATRKDGAHTLVRIDLDGDGAKDMQLLVLNTHDLGADNFIL